MNIFNPLLPYIILNNLYKVYFPLYKNLYYLYKRIKDKDEINLIKQVIKPGMVVIDIGANIGFYTLLFSKLVGKRGKVYAFEPETENFNHLKDACRAKNNIILNNAAAGKNNGILKLYISEQLNVDHQTFNSRDQRKNITNVKCLAMDQYFNSRKRIDLIKIDTQGFEYQVILGMKNIINRSKKIILLCEFSPYDLASARTSPDEFLLLLSKLHLKIKYVEKDNKKRLFQNTPNKMSYVNIFATKGY